jgi:hypothetical protein
MKGIHKHQYINVFFVEQLIINHHLDPIFSLHSTICRSD